MITSEYARQWWAWLRTQALVQPTRKIQAAKDRVPHPRDAGAYVSVGLPAGQDEDYRFPPEHDCRGVHVQSFASVWVIHVDVVHPACDPLEHMRVDAPGTWVAALTAAGGLVGLALGRRKEAAAAGALIGAALGLIGTALARTVRQNLPERT
jgi:hypothetical protein